MLKVSTASSVIFLQLSGHSFQSAVCLCHCPKALVPLLWKISGQDTYCPPVTSVSPAEAIPAVAGDIMVCTQCFLQSLCMKGLHTRMSCPSLPGDQCGCRCTSQGRCRSRLPLVAGSTNLCRLEGWFYSKIIRHIHPPLSLTNTGRCLQAPPHPKLHKQ